MWNALIAGRRVILQVGKAPKKKKPIKGGRRRKIGL